MTLGTQPQQGGTAMPRRGFFESIRGLAAAVVLMLSAVVFLAGCGGGSSPNPGNNNNNNNGTATITGRLVNRYAGNAAVIGATITYNRGGASQTSAVTVADGGFILTVPSSTNSTTTGTVYLTDPAGTTFYDVASVRGSTYNIKTNGVPVTLTSGQTTALGEIGVFADTGPPPPPVFP